MNSDISILDSGVGNSSASASECGCPAVEFDDPKKPAISILICNYNHGRFLKQCLSGLLRQTFRNFEIVLTDDGSTDDSRTLIADFAKRDSRIKPNYFEKNRGVMAAAADVSARAQGTLIFGEGADDFVVDDKFFERAIASLRAHPYAAGFFGTAGLLSAERNQLAGAMGTAPREGFLTPAECFRGFLKGEIFVPGSSSLWRRDLFNAFGGFDYGLGPQIDFLINHALPAKHGVVFARVPVTCQRIYEKAGNYGSKATIWEAADRYAKVEKIFRSLAPVYPGSNDDWIVWRARWMLDAIEKSGVKLR